MLIFSSREEATALGLRQRVDVGENIGIANSGAASTESTRSDRISQRTSVEVVEAPSLRLPHLTVGLDPNYSSYGERPPVARLELWVNIERVPPGRLSPVAALDSPSPAVQREPVVIYSSATSQLTVWFAQHTSAALVRTSPSESCSEKCESRWRNPLWRLGCVRTRQ
jgi:hypothetical protein